MSDEPKINLTDLVMQAIDRPTLKRICEMHEDEFADAYGLVRTDVVVKESSNTHWSSWEPDDLFYNFKDNGSSVLAVAHLDTVISHSRRMANFCDTADGPVIHSGALDDRLGAYTILELLPSLGINYDILLTTGEESGCSTASHFAPPKEYDWMIEFDRGGTDVVMYQYEDHETKAAVKACGARVGDGSFSDISYLEHLEIKGWNWGVGYQDYHGPRGFAYLEDYSKMIGYFLKFHEQNYGEYFPHEEEPPWWSRPHSGSLSEEIEDADCWEVFGEHDHDPDDCAYAMGELTYRDEDDVKKEIWGV